MCSFSLREYPSSDSALVRRIKLKSLVREMGLGNGAVLDSLCGEGQTHGSLYRLLHDEALL